MPNLEPEAADPCPPDMLPTPALTSRPMRMSYRIARGEQGVLSFEPYKSFLLPHWRFRTVPIAQHSSQQLYTAFTTYLDKGDFVGADMARKYIQMGMTRARRYGNYKGGRKYGKDGVKNEKSQGHEGKDEKDRASDVFRAVWRTCIEDQRYLALKGEFVKEQKVWDREVKKGVRGVDGDVKEEVKEEVVAGGVTVKKEEGED